MKISTHELISPVSRGILSIRGGAEAVDSIYIRSAVGYFNNLRVPAAVLMSIIMKEMFTLQNTPTASMRKWDAEHGVAHSKRWRILRYSYLLLMVLAFSLETFTIFVATQVLTELATASAQKMVPLVPFESNISLVDLEKVGGGFFGKIGVKKDPQSMVDFLIANFEFEYATCRFHFVTGILCFTFATALRVRYALRKYSDLSMSGMCCLLAVTTGMLTYTNAKTITYGGYVNLLKRQLQLSGRFLLAHVRSGPLSVITAILACLTVIYAILGSVSPEFAYFELDDEDNKKI
ncbi:hypothetical protein ACHAXA_004523 [Cyclostephanos tholiformis]|uniref:Uncharacterized protein n=1 Tax=Cyclostephanos tholiformis TaxID=382380 RepID=A0ABD3RV72_9STRA